MAYGGTAGLFFWDTGTRATPSISNRSHVSPEGAGHRPADLDSLTVFASGIRPTGNETIFSSVTVQVVGAQLPVIANQDAVPGQSSAALTGSSDLYRLALSAQRHPEDRVFMGNINENSPLGTLDWLPSPLGGERAG
jgi:hypothetical protein